MPYRQAQSRSVAAVTPSGEVVTQTESELHPIQAAPDYPHELVTLLASKLQSRGMGEVFSRRIALLLVRDGSQYTLDEISLILHECLGDAKLEQSNKVVIDEIWAHLPAKP